MDSSTLCPCCKRILKKAPQKKTKCPHCGDSLYIKYRPGEDASKKRLVGSKEAAEIEQDWHRMSEIDQQIRLERQLKDAVESRHPRMIALAKVAIARHFKSDQVTELEREHSRLSIEEYSDTSFVAYLEVNAKEPRCCAMCKALVGRRFNVETALNECVFPLEGCLSDRCFAWVSPVFQHEI